MLCCVGLFAGFIVGSMLGGPWTYVGPIIGFGLGLMGDTKLMRGHNVSHKGSDDRYGGVEQTHDKYEKDDEGPNRLRNKPEVTG